MIFYGIPENQVKIFCGFVNIVVIGGLKLRFPISFYFYSVVVKN